MVDHLVPALIIFFAVFTQSVTGFGVALIAMALLPGILSLHVISPLVALIALTLESILFIYYRRGLNIQAIWRVILASLVGIPLGILVLTKVNERLVLSLLGMVLSGYALYAISDLKLPELQQPTWAYITGLIAGVLGGAYNTSGPPVILYGHCRRWPPLEFKSNLQAFFLVSSAFVATAHFVNHSFTAFVLQHYLWSLPALGLGILCGTTLARYLNAKIFRKVVLVLVFIMGLRLILAA